MNSNRSSKVVAALLVLLAAATVPAAAVSVDGDAPDAATVGEKQTTTFTVTEPFSAYEQWTLKLQTDLTDVTWQITTYDNAGNQVNEVTKTGQSVSYQLQASSGVVRAEVKLVGTTPTESAFDWSYDPPQEITYAKFVQAQQGGSSETVKVVTARPYTAESQAARTAIQNAKAAIDDAKAAGADVSGAKSDLEDAIEFYNAGEFESATQNAEDAAAAAEAAASSARQTDLVIKLVGALVVLLVLAGGAYWYLNQRDTYDKLG